MIMENTAADYGRAPGMSGSTVKIIALITMLIDHYAACYLERVLTAEGIRIYLDDGADMPGLAWTYLIMRLIGRIAFPIFVFLLVEGFLHTRNRWGYLGRLCVFALLSEIPFDMAFNLTDDQVFSGKLIELSGQNVFFTLAIGLLVIIVLDFVRATFEKRVVRILLSLIIVGAGMALSVLLCTDYDCMGVLAIAVIYFFRNKRMAGVGFMCLLLTVTNFLEITAFLSLLPIAKYNGTRGLRMKYIFYVFYPLHLLLLWGLCIFMGYVK